MSAAQKRLSPEQRAWEYLKEVMHDDEKWGALKRGECIEVTGSASGKYFLYPNGHVVRLGKEKALLGKFWKDGILPYPDVLCTMYAWITMAEKEFLKNWGCGNISIEHRGVPHEVMARLSPSARHALENIEEDEKIVRRDDDGWIVRRDDDGWHLWSDDGWHLWSGLGMILPMIFIFIFGIVMLFVMLPMIQNLQLIPKGPGETTPTLSPSPTNSGLIDMPSSLSSLPILLFASLPIFMIGALILFVARWSRDF